MKQYPDGVWLHKHMEDGVRIVMTDGSGYDCPKTRGCWIEARNRQEAEAFLRTFRSMAGR